MALELHQAEISMKELIDKEINDHWSQYLDKTSTGSQNVFWKNVTNIVEDKNRKVIQPLINRTTGALEWDDKEILKCIE